MEKDNEYLRDKLLKMNEDTSLKQLQEYNDEMEQIRGFDNNSACELMLLFTEEVGELAKEIRKSENLFIENGKNKDIDLEGEIADVFMYILSICKLKNINLLDAVKSKELKNCSRVWK